MQGEEEVNWPMIFVWGIALIAVIGGLLWLTRSTDNLPTTEQVETLYTAHFINEAKQPVKIYGSLHTDNAILNKVEVRRCIETSENAVNCVVDLELQVGSQIKERSVELKLKNDNNVYTITGSKVL